MGARVRRKNGTGSIHKRKDGRWEGRIVIGHDENGKPKTKNVLAKTKLECQEKLNKLKSEILPETVKRISPDITFGEWIDYWYQTYSKPNIKQTTQSGYETAIYHHIIPEIGKIKLSELTTVILQKFYNDTKTKGRKVQSDIKGEGLSIRSVKACHDVSKMALDRAVKDNIIYSNPARNCKLPSAKPKEIQILTKEEISRVLIQAKEEDFYELLLMDIATGLRRGELLGLQWKDIDFTTGEVRITRQVVPIENKRTITEPKTKGSVRTVILSKPILEMLKKYREKTDSRWLFPSPLDKDIPREPTAVRKKFTGILEHAGCKHIRFHDLRHIFATMSIDNGVDIKTLADMMGHSTVKTIMRTYSHVTEEMQKKAAEKIDRVVTHTEARVEQKTDGQANTKPTQEKPPLPKFEPYRGKIRKRGTGCISQINDSLWEGRYSPKVNGKIYAKNIYAHSREECEEKLAELIKTMKEEIAQMVLPVKN